MILVRNIRLLPSDRDNTEAMLLRAAKKLRVSVSDIQSWQIIRRSLDARRKDDIHYTFSLAVSLLRDETALVSRMRDPDILSYTPPEPYIVPDCSSLIRHHEIFRPLVIGFGPAGMFAALVLARAGLRPLVLERGQELSRRCEAVEEFRRSGILNPESNVQFGEGGAGAFSDGKLNTGTHDVRIPFVLRTFYEHGAQESVLYDAKPHIGTDVLTSVVRSIREEILSLGGTVLFETRMEELIRRNSHVEGAILSHAGERREFLTDTVILCIGHSARDTVQSLFSQGVIMSQKPFAMGVRIEHPRVFIDHAQYGAFAGHPALGAASYKLICHTPDGRGVYTFCMCPGGHVIAAASQPGGVVVNGMSFHARDAENSNSALLVGVRTEDFGDDHPLAGMVLQRRIEKAAFTAAGGGFRAPAQRVGDFLAGRETKAFGDVRPSYRPGVTPADLQSVLPQFIADDLKTGIRAMNAQLAGFAMPDAVLTAPETRSSSPVRLLRNDTGESESVSGLFPAGEGAGFAGGIVSAAVDGIAAALKAIEKSRLL